MLGVEEKALFCPYCGEPIQLLIDCSIDEQRYVEDCQVCCRPMVVDVLLEQDGDDEPVRVQLWREDD